MAQELQEAREAVDDFVAELQTGIDSGDADISNAHFADAVMWGSPYGATVAPEVLAFERRLSDPSGNLSHPSREALQSLISH